MKYVIVGTAGHVDHGKTELTRALTGVASDRLQEEEERGISITLGFAPFSLPDGQKVGLIDVPGHEKFVKEMLAGAAGMDLVLLVVAADEGVMPQTKEHIDILRLLGVEKSIVVVTKMDLVDEEWLDMVMEDIRDQLAPTPYAQDEIIPVSAKTGQNIEALKALMARTIEHLEPKEESGQPRLPIDRAFTIKGFGTIVTGTLWSGQVRPGDQLFLLPAQRKVRIRKVQVHGEDQQVAYGGQRVALNLADVEKKEVVRGSVLIPEGLMEVSYRLDASFFLLEDQKDLAHRSRVHVHLGTSEVVARVYLLDREVLEAGQTAFIQLQCEAPLAASRQDRMVLRNYSPLYTLGGGRIIDPNPPKHRRFDQTVLDRLALGLKGSKEDLVLLALGQEGIKKPKEIRQVCQMDGPAFDQAVQALTEGGRLIPLADQLLLEDKARELSDLLVDRLEAYHKAYPLRAGISKEEVRSRFFSSFTPKAYQAFLEALAQEGVLVLSGQVLLRPGFSPSPSQAEKKDIDAVADVFIKGAFAPPLPSQVVSKGEADEEYLLYLLGQGRLVKLSEEVIFAEAVYEEAVDKIVSFLKDKGEIKLADARDLLGTSRKYVLPILERMDEDKITQRQGDVRLLLAK